ncbi:hypothetical protein MVES_001158 [Malassezia vespertilionis]|uniref:Uncharacterized protein n=2 Tax=Malassezia vespertilionis TaxID=2020962 RepID=A0A2N1JDY6_9BASI|nr:hypothetical protein MVES_001158 [Malassezia vespertilionis]
MPHSGARNKTKPLGKILAVAKSSACDDPLASDTEEEAAAADADGQGVWNHAFCVVCDCFIEPDGKRHERHKVVDDEDSTWEAAAVSSLQLHSRFLESLHVQDKDVPIRKRNESLFCSDECRKIDEERSTGLGEFMHYVARPPPDTHTQNPSRSSFTQPAFQRSGISVPARPTFPSCSLRHSQYSVKTAQAQARPVMPEPFQPLDGVCKTLEPVPVRTQTTPSNLSRARDYPSPKAVQGKSPSVRGEYVDFYEHSPPQSLVFDAAAEPQYDAASLATSPLQLLRGKSTHAGPSVSIAPDSAELERYKSNAPSAAVAISSPPRGQQEQHASSSHTIQRAPTQQPYPPERARRSSAVDSLLHAQGASCNAEGTPRTPPRALSSAFPWLRSARTKSLPPRTLEDSAEVQLSVSSTGSDASNPSQAPRKSRRSKDLHTLRPLLAVPPPSNDARRRTSPCRFPRSPNGSETMPPETDAPLSTTPSGRPSSATRGAMWSGNEPWMRGASYAYPSQSPRRSGLGWSALTPVLRPSDPPHPRNISPGTPGQKLDESDPDLHKAVAADAAMPTSSASATSLHGIPPRQWCYDKLPDTKMYPILQLPRGNVHDMYTHDWHTPSTPSVESASLPKEYDTHARRKSLFFFQGPTK